MSQVENPIQRSAYMSFFKDCIDEGAFIRDKGGFKLNEPIVDDTLKIYKDRLEIGSKAAHARPTNRLPANFDPQLQMKEGFKQGFSIIYRSGIVDILALRGASRFAGMDNLSFGDSDRGYLGPTSSYDKYLIRAGLKRTDDLKFPSPPKGKRSKHFTLYVSSTVILNETDSLVRAANQVGITIPEDPAIKTATVTHIAHEVGHAINSAFDNQGVLTRQRALELGFIRDAHLMVPSEANKIHREYFARAIENAVQYRYLQSLGLTPQQAELVMSTKTKFNYYQTEAIYALMEYASSKGFSPEDLITMRVRLNGYITTGKVDAYLYPLNLLICYFTKPYSEEQFQELVKR